MNAFKIIYGMFLQVICYKSVFTNDIVHYIDSINSLSNNFIIVKKEDKNDDSKNQNGEYYLIFDKNLKPVQRRFRDWKKDRVERKQAELLKTQQEKKVKELVKFMKGHQMTTNFLYNEMQRIKRQRMVKNDLRKMVEYLEKPGKDEIRSKILQCYDEARKNEALSGDIWGLQTNNLVINVLKDPYNDGYIN